MSPTMKLLSTSIALMMFAPATAFGAGFGVYEHSAKATGRVSAYTATVDDASAVFYNPAGLTEIKGGQIMVGLTMIRPKAKYTGPGLPSTLPPGYDPAVGQETNIGFIPVPNLYYGRQLTEKAYFGLGLYAPYGLGLNWGDDSSFVGRTVVQEISLRTFFITPAIALKLNEEFSAAIGVSIVPASVYLNRVLGSTDNGQVLFPAALGQEGRVELSGSGLGVSGEAGLLVKLLEGKLRLGLTYRTSTNISFTGKADFQLPQNTPTAIKAQFPDGGVTTSVTLPHSFAFGIGWVDSPLTVDLTVNYTLWESYDELRINFDSGLPQPVSASPRNWENSPTFRLGGQYNIDDFAIRAGVGYDITPAPDSTVDPTLPDSDRILLGLGGGAKFGPVGVDLAYMAVLLQERVADQTLSPIKGTYAAGAQHLISASVTFTTD